MLLPADETMISRVALPLRRRARAAGSGGAEREHPLHVPGHGDEAPLTTNIIDPAQQKLAEPHHRFDDPEYRFRGLFAQSIKLFAVGRLQTVGHGLDRRRVVRRRRRSGKSLAQRLMMRCRPSAISGSMFVAAQRVTLTSLK